MRERKPLLHLNFNREADEQHEHRRLKKLVEKLKRVREVEDC